MKPRFILLFFFFTFLLLFYPGASYYYNLFAYNRDLFVNVPYHYRLTLRQAPSLKTNTQPAITAEGAFVVDLPTFTPLFERNAKEKLLPASTTKIITTLVAYDLYKPDDVVTVKRVQTEGQVMGLVHGEQITVENLLYGALVHSGNDAAWALADHDPKGFDDFISRMNKKATQLGMSSSNFRNPAGLDDYSQLTTPYDLALAARALLRNPLLRKIVGTKEITIADIDFQTFHKLSNVNQLLGEVAGVGGLKTGYTENAGENLVSFYKKNGHEFLVVILKSQDRFADTKSVLSWIDSNIEYADLSL